MKNLKYYGIVLLTMLMISGCTKGWEDMNKDPNSITDVPAANILIYVQEEMTNDLYDMWFTGNNTSSYSGQIVKIQYIDENKYKERSGIINARWNAIMAYQMQLNKVIEMAQADGDAAMEGAAMVIKADLFQVMTDTWGAIPFTQGAQGESDVLQPAYDNQQTVYTGLLSMLKDANTLLAQAVSNEKTVSGDIINGGSARLWQKYANSLRMRVAIRMSDADAATAKTVLSEIINDPDTYPVLTSNSDLIGLDWIGSSPYYEPFYSDKISPRDDHGMCKTFIDALLATSDPRISEFAHPASSDNQYRGLTAGIPPSEEGFLLNTISRIGTRYRDLASGISYYFRYAEVEFIKAEAYARADLLNDATLAQTHYEAGIAASCEEHGVSAEGIASYLTNSNVAWSMAGTWNYTNLQKIYYQKWIALFKQSHETWAECRRTDIPVMSAAPGSLYTGHTRPPFRWPYPVDEYSLNADEVAKWDGNIVDSFWGEQMWWDTRTDVN